MSPLPPFPPGAPIDPLDPVHLDRYFAGEASAAEIEAIERWIAEAPGRRAEMEAIRQAVRADAPTSSLSLDIERALAATLMRAEGAGAPRHARRFAAAGRGSWMGWARVAATIVVAALLGVNVWRWMGAAGASSLSSMWRTASVPNGERATITLADGTQLTINAGTTVRYPRAFGRGDRDVYLDGEALFSVVHDERHPFRVHTAHAVATDIGTTFDVRAYTADGITRIAVIEGRVGLEPAWAASTPTHPSAGATLSAHDVAVVTDTAVAIKHDANALAATAWVEGRLVFEDTPLSEVASDIGRAFDLNIVVADTTLNAKRVTATFGEESADDVLDAVTRAVSARFERFGHRVVIRARDVHASGFGPGSRPAFDAQQRLVRVGLQQ